MAATLYSVTSVSTRRHACGELRGREGGCKVWVEIKDARQRLLLDSVVVIHEGL